MGCWIAGGVMQLEVGDLSTQHDMATMFEIELEMTRNFERVRVAACTRGAAEPP